MKNTKQEKDSLMELYDWALEQKAEELLKIAKTLEVGQITFQENAYPAVKVFKLAGAKIASFNEEATIGHTENFKFVSSPIVVGKGRIQISRKK